MHYALCTMHCALCTMHYALCIIYYALCTMQYLYVFTILYVFIRIHYSFDEIPGFWYLHVALDAYSNFDNRSEITGLVERRRSEKKLKTMIF